LIPALCWAVININKSAINFLMMLFESGVFTRW
jgi:hypothetical protein